MRRKNNRRYSSYASGGRGRQSLRSATGPFAREANAIS